MKKKFSDYLKARVKDYQIYENIGPGNDENPVTQITCGYDVSEEGWFAIVFDTRLKPSVDGEWSLYIEGNDVAVARWGFNRSKPQIEERVGERLSGWLREALDSKVFDSLPVTDECILTVEERNGVWGWSTHSENSDTVYLGAIESWANGLEGRKAITYWIGVLDGVAKGRYEDDEWGFLVDEFVFNKLEEFGSEASIPLIKFVEKWAVHPEYDSDRPKRNINENPMQSPVVEALQLIPKLAIGTKQELSLLRKILKKSIQVNESRRLWGIIPRWTAHALSELVEGYPLPEFSDSTNRLRNAGDFLRR